MAGKEGDVFEKNSRFYKNWKVLFFFLLMFASLLQQELCILSGFRRLQTFYIVSGRVLFAN